ncbi:MAG: hypothetical protein LBB62_03405, partial [Proteiniphilum sp.]|nr:hypothetical protein [Proteiniphilum sp.]
KIPAQEIFKNEFMRQMLEFMARRLEFMRHIIDHMTHIIEFMRQIIELLHHYISHIGTLVTLAYRFPSVMRVTYARPTLPLTVVAEK